jgi:hypothetical protein
MKSIFGANKYSRSTPFRIFRQMFSSALLCSLMLYSPCAQAAWISMVGGNTIDGSQLAVNNFGRAGTIGGFASGYYFYTFTRSGGFTTSNLTFSEGSLAWGQNSNRYIDNSQHGVGLSGIIPYGTECGLTESINIKFYSASSQQLVLSNIFIIRNPLQPIPVSNFRIAGSTAVSPVVIPRWEASSKSFLSNNIRLTYLGSGTVWKYRILIKQATSTGMPTGGFKFEQNWVMAAVPSVITLNNTLIGQTTGTPPTTWTYFLVTLETLGGPCTGGSGIHTALVLLRREVEPK